jgi:hypothetical protein
MGTEYAVENLRFMKIGTRKGILFYGHKGN